MTDLSADGYAVLKFKLASYLTILLTHLLTVNFVDNRHRFEMAYLLHCQIFLKSRNSQAVLLLITIIN